LTIRRDISLQSPTVATVKHGERLEILQQRRVFFRVRTPNGAEGWTSGSQLLSASDMDAIEQLAERAAKMPVQGEATTYELLRVHAQPSARSPSFIQIQPQEKFAVLAHVLVPRIELPRAPLVPPVPPKTPPPRKEPKPAAKIPPPPMPKPPGLPQNWQELSKPGLDEGDAAEEEPGAEPEPQPAEQPAAEDDWSLIRTAKQTGWVLTRRISMAIPDEVAQYAEGRRIVAYFSLGAVQDGDAKKDIWLWTTTGSVHNPYDFESFRVFIWSLRRHRYETAYIERNIEGYEPVLLGQFGYAGSGKARGEPVKYPGFSICLRKQNGSLVRRDYVLLTNIVRFAGERGCELPAPVFVVPSTSRTAAQPQPSARPAAPPAAENRGFVQKLKEKWRGWWHRR